MLKLYHSKIKGVKKIKTFLVTGGAGFIGSNFVKYLLKKYGKTIKIVVLDKLTYAGNLANLKDELDRVHFVKGDICNKELTEYIFCEYKIDTIVNFAAESHVDRSIENSKVFLKTNILGAHNLLEVAKNSWQTGDGKYKEGVCFLQVSTDEVYGSLGHEGSFTELSPLDPNSPYSASKASADMIAKAFFATYNFPVVITRCSNNYGPYQFPEKLIPLMIKNILEGKRLPVYGDGRNIRDWLYVEEHARAIDMVVSKGKWGEVYNIGGNNEQENITVVKKVIDTMREIVEKEDKYRELLEIEVEQVSYNLIEYVKDRPGHDYRYAIDPSKIRNEIGWEPQIKFEDGLYKTIRWYLDNIAWVKETC